MKALLGFALGIGAAIAAAAAIVTILRASGLQTRMITEVNTKSDLKNRLPVFAHTGHVLQAWARHRQLYPDSDLRWQIRRAQIKFAILFVVICACIAALQGLERF